MSFGVLGLVILDEPPEEVTRLRQFPKISSKMLFHNTSNNSIKFLDTKCEFYMAKKVRQKGALPAIGSLSEKEEGLVS